MNNLFRHPYTKIELVMRDLQVSRITATKYLDALARDGLLQKARLGRANYYMNVELVRIRVGSEEPPGERDAARVPRTS